MLTFSRLWEDVVKQPSSCMIKFLEQVMYYLQPTPSLY